MRAKIAASKSIFVQRIKAKEDKPTQASFYFFNRLLAF